LVGWLVGWLVRSLLGKVLFARWLVRWLVRSSVGSVAPSLLRSLLGKSLVRWFARSLVRSFARSPVHPFHRWFVRCRRRRCCHRRGSSFVPSFVPSFLRSLTAVDMFTATTTATRPAVTRTAGIVFARCCPYASCLVVQLTACLSRVACRWLMLAWPSKHATSPASVF